MGLSEALVMQQVDGRRSPERRDPILDRTFSYEVRKRNSTIINKEVKPVFTENFRTEQTVELKSRKLQNDLSAESKPQNISHIKGNVTSKIENQLQNMSKIDKTIQANKCASYSKGDEHEILQNKNFNDEKQNKADEKSVCDEKCKLCYVVCEKFKEENKKSDINKHDKLTTKGTPKLEASQYAVPNAEKEKFNICAQKEAKIPEKTIKEKEQAAKIAATEGKENSEQDPEMNLLEKQMAEMQLKATPELTKENIVKHAKTLRKLLLKIKIKDSTSAEASKSSLQSPKEEEGLVERSPVQQSFVSAPLQSGSIVTQDTTQTQPPDASLNISLDSLDWNMLSEVDVRYLYSIYPELFDGILDSAVQDNTGLNEMDGAGTNTVLPEPVASLNNELSNSPQATFMLSPRSEISAVNSPIQYVPSTPYAPSMVSGVTSPPSLFLPDSPESSHNHELEKLSPEDIMCMQTPDFNTAPLSAPNLSNTDMIYDMNLLANADDIIVVGNTATANEVTSTTMNPSQLSSTYWSEFSDTVSLTTWMNTESAKSPTSTNIGCSQQEVMYVTMPSTADSLSQPDGIFNTNSSSSISSKGSSSGGSSSSSSSSSSSGSSGSYSYSTFNTTRMLESIRRAPTVPCIISDSAKSRLEAKLNENVKVNAIVNIWRFNDKQVSEGDENGDTQLMILVSKAVPGQNELVHALVERLKSMPGNPLAAVNGNGESALLISSVLLPNHPLIARYIAETLLETGAHLDQVDNCGKSPIHYLAERGNTHLVVLTELLSLRDRNNMPCFDVNRRCEEGTPLHIAIRSHHTRPAYGKEVDCGSTALFLISQGANVNAKDSQGQTILHLATRSGCDPCLLQILLRICPHLVNVKDDNGDTPLHCAAMRNDIPLQRQANVVRLLVNNGACRSTIGSNGRAPLGLVAPERKHEIGLMLQRR